MTRSFHKVPFAASRGRVPAAFLTTLLVALLAAGSVRAEGVAVITVAVDSNGACSVQGSSIVKAAAFEFTLTYDTATLSNPRVQQGPLLAGAFNAVNAQSPGKVRFAAVTTTPFSGTGMLASIAFDASSKAGSITAFTAKLASLDGKSIPVTIRIVNSGQQPEAQDAQAAAALPLTTAPAAAALPVIAGVAIPVGPASGPGETRNTTEALIPQGKEENAPGSEQLPRPSPLHPAQAKSEGTATGGKTRTIYEVQSILDRFKQVRGIRTLASCSALFEQDEAIGLRQEPAIVLTDGKARATITFIAPVGLKGTPDVALIGAQMVSLARDPDATNTWVAVLLPYRNTWDGKITISFQNMTMAHQLAIAPPVDVDLDRSGKLTGADFDLFQRERGTAKAPLHDLNRDGKRDYVDDYIFMSNYLANKRK